MICLLCRIPAVGQARNGFLRHFLPDTQCQTASIRCRIHGRGTWFPRTAIPSLRAQSLLTLSTSGPRVKEAEDESVGRGGLAGVHRERQTARPPRTAYARSRQYPFWSHFLFLYFSSVHGPCGPGGTLYADVSSFPFLSRPTDRLSVLL